MAIIIKEIDATHLEVNTKLVIRDPDGNWKCRFTELTPNEEKALYEYLKAQDLRLDKRVN